MTDKSAQTGAVRRTHAEIEAAVDRLLSRPESFALAAINSHGLFVPLPPGIDLRHHRTLTGYASALDLVVPDDAQPVIEMWERALATGSASTAARLARAEGHEVTLHVFDLTDPHGVYLGVVDISASAEAALDGGDNPALRPRVGWMRKDQLAVVVEVDDAVPLMLGWTKEQMLTIRTLDFLDPDDHNRAISSWMSMLAEPGCRRRVRLRHKHANGSWRWFDVTNHNRLNDARHNDVFTEMVDVTEEMEAQEALRARENLLRRLTETLPVGLLQFDRDLHVLYCNDRLATMLGTAADHLPELLTGVADADRERLLGMVADLLRDGADRSVEVAVQATGATRRLTVALRALTDDAGSPAGGIACLTDVTESVELREQLADRATYDPLTRCQNRASILATLQERLDTGGEEGVAVVFVDLDGFKQVNDELGHVAGDRVLTEAARRLALGVRGDDAVGRLGGDEFLVVCSRVHARSVALRIGRRIAAALQADSPLNAGSVDVRASIGVAWSAGGPAVADALVAEADQAMYESKRAGRGKPVVRDLAVVSALPRHRRSADPGCESAAAAPAPDEQGRSTRG